MNTSAIKIKPRAIASRPKNIDAAFLSTAVRPAHARDPSTTRRIIPTGTGPTIMLCALGLPIPVLLIILMIYFHQV